MRKGVVLAVSQEFDKVLFAKRFGELVDRWAADNPRGQAAFADAVGVSPSAVSQWRSGTAVPGGDRMPLIARTLGVPLGYLLLVEDDPNPPEPLVAERIFRVMRQFFAPVDDEERLRILQLFEAVMRHPELGRGDMFDPKDLR
jgi:transcriptional regulator with XRE-family HTH domain